MISMLEISTALSQNSKKLKKNKTNQQFETIRKFDTSACFMSGDIFQPVYNKPNQYIYYLECINYIVIWSIFCMDPNKA